MSNKVNVIRSIKNSKLSDRQETLEENQLKEVR